MILISKEPIKIQPIHVRELFNIYICIIIIVLHFKLIIIIIMIIILFTNIIIKWHGVVLVMVKELVAFVAFV